MEDDMLPRLTCSLPRLLDEVRNARAQVNRFLLPNWLWASTAFQLAAAALFSYGCYSWGYGRLAAKALAAAAAPAGPGEAGSLGAFGAAALLGEGLVFGLLVYGGLSFGRFFRFL
eukprot:SAG22_NODE_5721_length_965_cov_1.103926_2_plen_114_part_01